MLFRSSDLADDVVRNTDLDQGLLIGNPDVSKLAECITAFRDEAVQYASG